MAFGNTPAGTITKEQTRLSIRRFSVGAGVNIAKGDVCAIDPAAGTTQNNLVQATNGAKFTGAEWYVALEPANNTSGTNGTISAPVAVKGHYVTVVAAGVIQAGMPVKMSSTAGQVIQFVENSDAEGLKVGIYFGEEGGKISKATTTPFLESFTDTENFVPTASATGDVIEILLR